MKPEYQEYLDHLIAQRRIDAKMTVEKGFSDNGVVHQQCMAFTKAFVEKFPHLRRERGFYVVMAWGEPCPNEHWWCVDTDGTIVDPTAAQFRPGGRYSPYDDREFPCRTGGCPECGGDVYEDSNAKGFCSLDCHESYSLAMA